MSARENKARTADDAKAITQSLRRSQQLLQHELERVSHVSAAIEQDGKILGDTKSHHMEMKDNVKDAKKALNALEMEKKKEQLILMSAIIFYALVVCYVLWTRIPLFGVDYLLGRVLQGLMAGLAHLKQLVPPVKEIMLLKERAVHFIETKLPQQS